MIKSKLSLTGLTVFAAIIIFAETYAFDHYFTGQPMVFIGADAGYFRISFNQFEELYESRWGPVYGAHGGVRVYSRYYLTGKFHKFERDGKSGEEPKTGKNTQLAKWQEQWYTIGARMHSFSDTKWNSFYGFGYAFFEVREQAGLSLYNEKTDSKKTGGGFYLELGVQRYLLEKVCAFIQLEITSAGIGGRSGFEGQSIGGYSLLAGLSIWLL